MRAPRLAILAVLTLTASANAQQLTAVERRIRDHVRAHAAEQVDFLGKVIDINSGTLNLAGVRAVGAVFEQEFRALGFETRWVAMPDSVHRAGHFIAERRGKRGKRLLLVGHLDTVFEGEGQRFVRLDSVTAKGAGSSDMKGGDVAILYALKAMQAAGALDDVSITVVFTGDEESAGHPLEIARRDLVEAARQSDAALGFEGGSREYATVARRGSSAWLLRVTGKQAHSGGIFNTSTGYGANFELARILDGFRQRLAGQPNLTFSPSVIVGGTDVRYDSMHVSGAASSKLNIVARAATASGDLRFLSEGQKDSARATMREVASQSLPGTSAAISFSDEYPSMPPTAGNQSLLATFDSVSQALGYGKVSALEPGRRGAGDVSFIAADTDVLDGLGVDGAGAHTPDERVDLPSMQMATERAALLFYRLTRGKRPAPRTATGR